MKYVEKWFDEYRGIRIEVSRHSRSDYYTDKPIGIFTFYLHLLVEQFPESEWPKLWVPQKFTDFGTPLYGSYALEDLDWHCGITWYSKEGGPDGPFRAIKVGCDYDHYWDQEYLECYTPEQVMSDAKACVDSLFAHYPKLKTAAAVWEEHRMGFPKYAESKLKEKENPCSTT